MTVHFAAARDAAISPIARALITGPAPRAANDNRLTSENNHLLHSALRHFAQHGLGAAQEARKQAERAFFAGERDSYDWWLSVCRTLDRRMAEEIARMEAK